MTRIPKTTTTSVLRNECDRNELHPSMLPTLSFEEEMYAYGAECSESEVENELIFFDDPSLTPSPRVYERSFRKKVGNLDLDIFREIFSRGINSDASKSELKKLWRRYVTKKELQTMGPKEMKKLIFAMVEFCKEFATYQMKWFKNGVKTRNSVRSDLEYNFSNAASRTVVHCNAVQTNLNVMHKASFILKEIFGTNRLEISKAQFLKEGNQFLSRMKAKLEMHLWANEVEVGDPTLTPDMKWMEQLQLDQVKRNNTFLVGTLRICVIGALGLVCPMGKNKPCNPYAILTVKSSSVPTVFRTGTNNPEWSQSFKFVKYSFKRASKTGYFPAERAHLHIMNWSQETKKAQKLCSVSFELPNEFTSHPQLLELPLDLGENSDEPGYLNVSIELKEDRPELETAPEMGFKIGG